MSSPVSFDRIKKSWLPRSRGEFELVFGGVYELYIDKSKSPDICADILPMVQSFLSSCWPEKYSAEDGVALDFFLFTQYPASQQAELLRATEAYLADLEADLLDSKLIWNKERREMFVSALHEFLGLMREELGAH